MHYWMFNALEITLKMFLMKPFYCLKKFYFILLNVSFIVDNILSGDTAWHCKKVQSLNLIVRVEMKN